MKIKKQFVILISLIIATPIICILFVWLEYYIKSPNRYLIDGYKQVEEIEDYNRDYSDALKILSLIPKEVQSSLVDLDTEKIITNTIPEFKGLKKLNEIAEVITNTAKNYFYQVTSPKTEKNTVIITRIPRVKPKRMSNDLIKTLLVILSVCIATCIIAITILSKTIFRSIMNIKNATIKIANGNINETVLTKKDKKNDNEIMSILENIEKMRLSLCDAETRKSKFIMGVSHDLRTPVAIIKGYTEAITDEVITSKEDVNKALSLVQVKTTQLESMINELIDFTKLTSYELKEHFELYSVTELIRNFAKESKLSANVFKREIVCNIKLPKDISLPINKQLITRALENIFSNALKYTRDGDKIEIISYVESKAIILKISDTGVGISDQDLPHIFDLFYKSSTSREGQSMGIGLSVVKSVFDAHGWDVKVTSEKNKGTTFTINIPILYFR